MRLEVEAGLDALDSIAGASGSSDELGGEHSPGAKELRLSIRPRHELHTDRKPGRADRARHGKGRKSE